MVESKPAPVQAPREFVLEFAEGMDEVWVEDVLPEEIVENAHLVAGAGEPWNARGVYLVGVVAEGLELSGTQWGQTRVTESAFRRCSAVELFAIDARWERVECEGARLGFANFSGAFWQQVSFTGGKTNDLNLRESSLKDVRFQDVKFGSVDLAHANAERVSFGGCQIEELVLHGAYLQHVDLRGAEIGTVVGVDSLRGTVIDEYQLSALAPQLAGQLGITVR